MICLILFTSIFLNYHFKYVLLFFKESNIIEYKHQCSFIAYCYDGFLYFKENNKILTVCVIIRQGHFVITVKPELAFTFIKAANLS